MAYKPILTLTHINTCYRGTDFNETKKERHRQ